MPTRDAEMVFEGPGEVRRVARAVDWAATPLGPVASWSPLLRGTIRTVFRSGFPILINWGPELVTIYNDACLPLMGAKHPLAIGSPMRDVWPESWDRIRGRIDQVVQEGHTTRGEDERYMLERHGYPEECYFTFSESPVVENDGTIVGMLTVSNETTGKILNERRMGMVRDLGLLSVAERGSTAETCVAALEVMEKTRETVPFAVAFLEPDDGGLPQRVAAFGLTPDACARGLTEFSGDPAGILDRVVTLGKTEEVTGLGDLVPGALLPGPLGDLVPDAAMVVPLTVSGRSQPIGALVLGVNPYRRLDDEYRAFFALLGRQIRVALTDTVAYAYERSRVQVLADLDRAKMEFFQNVSHELRTPLTLLLAPLQDMLETTTRGSADREDLEAAVRAADRLRRMVDALLDFSGAEAGSVTPSRDPVDLGGATVEVASMFRSTAQHAGLQFTVTVPPFPVVAPVDRAMWSTIVTNLLSNAVKYTPAGSVDVALALNGSDGERRMATLTVTDTGVGIPSEQLGHVFERSYRGPETAAGEGAGLGLAIVSDLVRALSGSVDVVSEPGQGSTFTVTLPLGTVPSAVWTHGLPQQGDTAGEGRPRVLIVEDDADLRGFLTRLLVNDGWAVEAVSDAETGLIAAAGTRPFDVVLTDLMLPGRNGLELVAELRTSHATSRVPIIILTARGGVDAAAEGLAAGADDYITKPFSSRELLARVRANHELYEVREHAVEQAQDRERQIRGALDSNRLIGTAVGIVMATYQLTAKQGFALLVRSSQHTNSKLRDVAAVVVETGALPFRRTMIDEMLTKVGETGG
jgi:signal transduction histidine kinase/DNA-binding response OmpR family regulator